MKPITLKGNIKILIIRRDNIGDLLLTTPLIHSLRERYPLATIDVLVNSYNAPIIDRNKDINNIHAYTKGKHRGNRRLLSVYTEKLKMLIRIRKIGYDLAILTAAKNPIREFNLAKFTKAKKIISFSNSIDPKILRSISYLVDNPFSGTVHLVDELHYLAIALGVSTQPGPLILNVKPEKDRRQLSGENQLPVIGIHISTRKLPQRWPIDNFSELMHQLYDEGAAGNFILFWSPGPDDHPQHPGDDIKAKQLIKLTKQLPVTPYPTQNLSQLIAGMNLTDRVICSDGGAMHIAAALQKPILCFFGNSDPIVWHPWKVPYQLIQPDTLNVNDISVDDALSAWNKLDKQISALS